MPATELYLHVFFLSLLAFSCFLGIPVPFCSSLLEDVIVAPVSSDLEVVQVEHVCAGRVEEVTGVTNNQQSLRPLYQVVLQGSDVSIPF